jgi:hypothetical protein
MQRQPKESGMLRSSVLSFCFVAFATGAFAQTIVINPSKPPIPTGRAAQPVRISIGVNTFVPVPDGDAAQALKAQEEGRRMVYQLAAGECALLREVLASDCRLESVNVNVQRLSAERNYVEPKVAGYNINGTVNYEITPK